MALNGSLPCRAPRRAWEPGRATIRLPAGAATLRDDLPLPRSAPGTVRRAFERLSEEQRTVLRLVNVDRLSYQEGAAKLGIPRELFVEQLIRARRSLARALADASGS